MDHEEISKLRGRIDRLDKQIVELLNERASVVAEIGEIKRRLGLPIYDGQREEGIIAELSATNKGPLPDETLAAIYHDILRHMKEFE